MVVVTLVTTMNRPICFFLGCMVTFVNYIPFKSNKHIASNCNLESNKPLSVVLSVAVATGSRFLHWCDLSTAIPHCYPGISPGYFRASEIARLVWLSCPRGLSTSYPFASISHNDQASKEFPCFHQPCCSLLVDKLFNVACYFLEFVQFKILS